MRALVCRTPTGYRDLEVAELASPSPGEGEVRIAVTAAGLNFPDLLITRGAYQFRPDPPFVPGGECVGVVDAVGTGVRRLAVGDRVVATAVHGAFAEKMVVPESSALPAPESLDDAIAAGVSITYATSLYALRQCAALREGETLLVLGAAGGVGSAAVELGRVLGGRVIAAASTEEKLEAARAAGADETIQTSEEPLKERVKQLTAGRGVDVTVDPVGGDQTEAAFRAIAWGGRHLVIGFAAGRIPELPLNLVLLKGACVTGVFWGAWTRRDPEGAASNFADLTRWFAEGQLSPRVTAHRLEDFREAFDSLAERRVVGKAVLTIG